uniref:Uncharacterized protein n=1 Tax=Varanus komodoensis TaxID=61221 RepID=A0A8D2Q3S0_VARKO
MAIKSLNCTGTAHRKQTLQLGVFSFCFFNSDHATCASIKAMIHFKILKGHSDAVTSCHFCFEDTKVISASYDSTVKLWPPSKRAPEERPQWKILRVRHIYVKGDASSDFQILNCLGLCTSKLTP